MAAAQAVPVRSGEHDGFSRLVITLPTPAEWRFGRVADGYELRIAGAARRFDLSRVFTFIPRDRLAAIWADPTTGALRLGVRCACHAVAFLARPQVIVLDIRSGAADPASGFERALDAPDGPALAPLGAGALAAAPPPAVPEPPPTASVLPLPAGGTTPRLPVLPPEEAPDPRVADLRDALLRQVGRAAAQGLVDPVERLSDRTDRTVPPPAPPRVADAEAPPTPPDPDRTHVDIRPGGTVRGGYTADGRRCIPDAALPFDAPIGENVAQSLSDARRTLLGEFDTPDPRALETLLRLYLTLGFGAEARNAATAFGVNRADLALLDALATVVDGGIPTPGHPLTGMEVCDGAVALWAVLAAPALRPGDRPDTAAVVRAFSALPLHMRRDLAPQLADRFLSLGDTTTAQAVRDAVARAPGGRGAELTLVDAQMHVARGDLTGAEAMVRTVIRDSGPRLPEAQAMLAEIVVAQGGSVDARLLSALAALAREYRGTPVGERLQRATVAALAASGDFTAAFGSAGADTAARSEVWSILASRGNPAAIILHASETSEAETQPQALRRVLAARLLDERLPEPALAWLGEDDGTEAGLLRSRAALLHRDGRGALRALAGASEPEAVVLRAEALALIGEGRAAAEVLRDAELRAAAATEAWRSRDWLLAATLASEDRSAIIATLAPATDSPADPAAGPAAPITLASARDSLGQSAKARAAVADLLREVAPPAAD